MLLIITAIDFLVYTLRKIIITFAIFLAFNTSSKADSFDEIVRDLNKPYAVTKAPDSGVRCVWTKGENGYLQSENFANEGTSLCWSKEALSYAEEMNNNGSLQWLKAVAPPAEFFTDLHNACFYGYMGKETGDWETYAVQKYAKTIGKYSGQANQIEKLGKAFDFGKKVSKTPHDCMYIAERLTGHG